MKSKMFQRAQTLFRQLTGQVPKNDTTRWRSQPRFGVVMEAHTMHQGEPCYRVQMTPEKEVYVPRDRFNEFGTSQAPQGAVVELKAGLAWEAEGNLRSFMSFAPTPKIKRLPHDQIGHMFLWMLRASPERAQQWAEWMGPKDFPKLSAEEFHQLVQTSNPEARQMAIRLGTQLLDEESPHTPTTR